MLDIGWGAVFGVVLPIGLLAQLRCPERRIAGLQQSALVVVALAAAGVAGGAWRYVVLAAVLGVAIGGLVALHPARGELLRREGRPSPLLFGLALAAAAPCVVYVRRMASAQRRDLPPFDAVSNGMHHWTVLGALALSVVLLVFLAAIGTPGWRIPAWSAALGAGLWAVSCLRCPESAGSEGRAWALAVLAWAAAVVVSARYRSRAGAGP
ncbi:MAG: hypothetical protein QOE36_1266 [Gaiellaceae bacterium]|nr:hypothetical protein [Gaiellaceae bacterium]